MMKRLLVPVLFSVSLVFLSISACDKGEANVAQGIDLELTFEERQKVAADNRFAIAMFAEALKSTTAYQNTFISPLSISTVLSMTNRGAAGDTYEAINKTLRAEGFSETVTNGYYQKLMAQLPLVDPKTTLDIANSLWYKEGFAVLPDFLQNATDHYQAKVSALDFADPGAVNKINTWANQKTRGKIPSILELIPGNAVMYLINAVYFKSEWAAKFNPENTVQSDFVRNDGTTVLADFMHNEGNYKVGHLPGFTAIELPYNKGKFSMVVVKPDADADIESSLQLLATDENWQSLIQGMLARNVNLQFPKFKFSYENQLKDELQALGMGVAFGSHADFSRIHATAPLEISEVKHKSFIEVDEKGSEATAVTSVGVVLTSMPTSMPFKLDRSFLFAIREVSSGLILFVGQVNDPTVTETKMN